MVGYTEVLQTIMAMTIFSIILLSANRMMHRNTQVQVEGELEREVIALAQNIIEESRTLEFDENSTGAVPPVSIPGSFTNPNELGPDEKSNNQLESRDEFNDFDDFHGWSDSYENRHGEFYITAEVTYLDPDTHQKVYDQPTTFKMIEVEVTNKFLTGSDDNVPIEYEFSYIRNYHAD